MKTNVVNMNHLANSKSIILVLILIGTSTARKRDCGGTLKSPYGSIKSPRYPNLYPNNINCSWHIEVASENVISLKTVAFDIEESPRCTSDALYIYDGQNASAKLFGKPYCGNNAPPALTSSQNSLYIVFITDHGWRRNGFHFDYQAVPNCRKTIKKKSGVIVSPGYPISYFPNANCSYLIKVGEHRRVKLRFLDVDIEPHDPVSGSCSDHVSVYDVNPTGLVPRRTICGKVRPPLFLSATNKLYVRFLSDSSDFGKGFIARFTSYEYKCRKGEYSCKNAICISKLHVCNGRNECGDWSDEESCPCKTNEWKCHNGYCISADLRCNGVKDCLDGSDEQLCTKNVTSACATDMPHCQKTCTHTGTSLSCRCSEGYQLNKNQTCEDIDECINSNGGCQEKCTNTMGSYKCGCLRSGFIMKKGKCVDLDECAANRHACEHICVNTVGSYICKCLPGYWKDYADPRKCEDWDECMVGVPSCFDCENTIGSFYCRCGEGFRVILNRTRCEDIDECAQGTSGCTQLCENRIGSYVCSCRRGFRLSTRDSRTCLDIDECRTQRVCGHDCINTYGSYRCICRSGYKLVYNKHCVDINECGDKNLNRCQGTCINEQGSYRCTCADGYLVQKDGSCIGKDSYQICGKAAVSDIPSQWKDVTEETWGWQSFFTVTIGSFELLLDGCMGVIISDQFILTAAPCLLLRDWLVKASNLTAFVRQTNLNGGQIKGYQVEEIKLHKIGGNKKADIALLKLSQPITFDNRAHAICLPKDGIETQLSIGKTGALLAWGRFDSRRSSSLLKYRGVTIKDVSRCHQPENMKSSNYLCTEYKGGENAKHCAPSSGAPLMVKSAVKYGDKTVDSWILGGILTYGGSYPTKRGCHTGYRYNVIQRVDSIMPWIMGVIKGSQMK